MTLEAGSLRHRVTIKRQVIGQNSENGARTTAWETVATVWAAIAPMSAREFVAANALQSKVTTRIVIRYRSGLKASMRVQHGAKVYNIEGVLADKESGIEYLTLACSEGVNNG